MEAENIDREEELISKLNLKLHPAIKNIFKKITKNRRTSMQSVLELFVEMYVKNPDIFNIKMEMNMSRFPKPSDMIGNNLKYESKEYKNLFVDRVIEDGKPKDEYYIKIKNKIRPDLILSFISNTLPGCEIDLIDPDNILNLDHQIFIVVRDELITDSIPQALELIDEGISETFFDNNKKGA